MHKSLFERVEVSGSALRYVPSAALARKRLFRGDLSFHYDGPAGEALGSMPTSILWSPGLFNVAPLVWAFGLTLSVPFRHEPMERGLEKIRAKLQQFYPSMSWAGRIVFEGEMEPTAAYAGAVAFYSGGLDSVQTVYRHFDEHPELVFLDLEALSPAFRRDSLRMAREFARAHQLSLTCIATNIATFIDRDRLNFGALRAIGQNWWTGVQYGLGMTSAAAPVAYVKRAGTVYYASSFNEEFNVAGGSDPELEGNVAWPGSRVIHDSFDRTRQRKIEMLAADRPMPSVRPYLQVCHGPLDGLLNCGTCEKCLRTMAGLMVEGEEPADWGFKIDGGAAMRRIANAFAAQRLTILGSHKFMWTDIRRRAAVSSKCPPELARWLADLDLEPHYRRSMRRSRLLALIRRLGLPGASNLMRAVSKARRRLSHRKAISSL
jgi:hypothetical protein